MCVCAFVCVPAISRAWITPTVSTQARLCMHTPACTTNISWHRHATPQPPASLPHTPTCAYTLMHAHTQPHTLTASPTKHAPSPEGPAASHAHAPSPLKMHTPARACTRAHTSVRTCSCRPWCLPERVCALAWLPASQPVWTLLGLGTGDSVSSPRGLRGRVREPPPPQSAHFWKGSPVGSPRTAGGSGHTACCRCALG